MKLSVVACIFTVLLFVHCQSQELAIRQADRVSISSGHWKLGKKGHRINPAHSVKNNPFAIGRYEVTNAEFEKFVKATGYITVAEKDHNAQVYCDSLGEFIWCTDTAASWRFPQGKQFADYTQRLNEPVTCICFDDAIAYCQWAGVRLPTLDEWEIAARAGSRGTWFFGNRFDSIVRYGNCWHARSHYKPDSSDGYPFTAPVGKYLPNDWGLYDMYGNVFEFCADKPAIFASHPEWASARGGSWWCSKYSCNFVNSVDIGRVHRRASFSNLGFRVVYEKMKSEK